MSEFHSLDIEFPDVDFSPYYKKSKTEIDKIHHAHLFARTDEIELRIFYDGERYFGEKLSVRSNTVDYKKFGSFIKVKATENQKKIKVRFFPKKLPLSRSTHFLSTKRQTVRK